MMVDRERVGRDASPTAAIIDSQSAKTTEAGGAKRQGRGDVVTHALSQCNPAAAPYSADPTKRGHRPESNAKLRVTAAPAAALSEERAS